MPWCPKCGYEYKRGYTICSDCNVELVETLDKTSENDLLGDEIGFTEEDLYAAFEQEGESDQNKEELSTNRKLFKSGVYEECAVRANEYKSGAVTLLFVGIAGIIVLVLMNVGVIPVFKSASSTMINIVVGGMLVFFVVMGFMSVSSYKKLKVKALEEQKLKNDIMSYFEDFVNKDDILCNNSDNLGPEELTLWQFEQIKSIILKEFSNVDELFLEYITEKIYENMFEV